MHVSCSPVVLCPLKIDCPDWSQLIGTSCNMSAAKCTQSPSRRHQLVLNSLLVLDAWTGIFGVVLRHCEKIYVTVIICVKPPGMISDIGQVFELLGS